MAINPVGDPPTALPPKIRAIIYWVYFGLTLLLGAAQVGFWAAGVNTPMELRVAIAIVLFLGSGFGLTAASHVVTRGRPLDPAQPEAQPRRDLPRV